MPIVFSNSGSILAEVDDNLYKDFLEQTLVYDKPIAQALDELISSKDFTDLSEYIKWRLAEVDPGYAPDPI